MVHVVDTGVVEIENLDLPQTSSDYPTSVLEVLIKVGQKTNNYLKEISNQLKRNHDQMEKIEKSRFSDVSKSWWRRSSSMSLSGGGMGISGSTGLGVIYGGERRGSGSEGVTSSDKAIS
jgi:hypothetical protein